jgi:transcriptional regulator with XRE-family HTH domain
MPRSSFQPNLDKIESFRIKRGWTIDDLAAKAVCSPRTINSLKKGNRVQIKTVRKIAKAFGVSFESLLIGYVETPNEKGPRVTIRIELGIPFGSFTSSAKMEFRDLLIALLQSTDGINVTSVVAGSTIITLDMSARDAFRLIYLARATRDHDLGIEHDTEGLILS